ncbi:MAG TPA: hypothetical protein VGH90_05170, partial [Chthoniobacteraceae bacterium]
SHGDDGKSGCHVSVDGRVSTFNGTFGSPRDRLSEEHQTELARLLHDLPGDGAQLPPAGRRLLLQAYEGGHVTNRVYDRANLPQNLLLALRLVNSRVQSWSPVFPANSNWKCDSDSPLLCASSDGKNLVSVSSSSIQIWDPSTGALLDHSRWSQGFVAQRINFNPDRSRAVLTGDQWDDCLVMDPSKWRLLRQLTEPAHGDVREGLSDGHFSPDGKKLYLRSDHGLRVYDTKTWKAVKSQPNLPPDALNYIPADDGRRAVFLSKNGELILWDAQKAQQIALLDKDLELQCASFSPNNSRIAVISKSKDWPDECRYKLRVWNADSGEMVNQYWTRELATCDHMQSLVWTPDGEYLLAQSEALWSDKNIRIWNVKTGRERGELAAHGNEHSALTLVDAGHKLAFADSFGKIEVWNLDAILEKVRDFEKSFP